MPPKKRTFSFFIPYFLLLILVTSCSIQKQISKTAKEDVLSNKALSTAHVGISIFEPAAGKYWFNYQGDHYFVPASNTKLPTCYAAMKYLGDSLVGLRYKLFDSDKTQPPLLAIEATGDPTFLHPDFKNQPVYSFLKSQRVSIVMIQPRWYETGLGPGWSWSDYAENYMAERSPMPIYGNVARFTYKNNRIEAIPKYFLEKDTADGLNTISEEQPDDWFVIKRELGRNNFYVSYAKSGFKKADIPFVADIGTITMLLYDTLKTVSTGVLTGDPLDKNDKKIYSQATDSLLKPMMHRSDNFFAEQSLLMVSNERLGVMNNEKIIDTLLKTDFKDLPQKPRWVDGSGLSRYNLFTPQDFVAILNKMKNDFGMERIKVILPTGGEGTISSYYKADSGYIYGKTGTLSGVVAFSGFLYTKKGKLLIFSTIINNHQASATDIRKVIEKFLQEVRSKY